MCHRFENAVINSLEFVEASAKINSSSSEIMQTVPQNSTGSREASLTP